MAYREEIKYNGFTIGVRQDYQFEIVEEPLKGHHRPSLGEAKDEIDTHLKATEKQHKTKLAIKALDGLGRQMTITGIHAVKNQILPQSKDVESMWISNPRETCVFPDVLWIAELLQERESHFRRISQIDRALLPFKIERSRGYRQLRAEHYDATAKNLQNEIEEKTTEAQKGPRIHAKE